MANNFDIQPTVSASSGNNDFTVTKASDGFNIPKDADTTVDDLLTAPARMTNDEGSVTERPISALLEGQRYQDAQTNVQKPPHGAIISKIKPGSTLG